jgi:hypothetical protein
MYFLLDFFISFVHSRSVSKFTGKTFHHRNGVKAVYLYQIFELNDTCSFKIFLHIWKKYISLMYYLCLFISYSMMKYAVNSQESMYNHCYLYIFVSLPLSIFVHFDVDTILVTNWPILCSLTWNDILDNCFVRHYIF